MNNILLDKIKKDDYNSIFELTSDLEVMKYIGNGLTWSKDKVKRFIDFCLQDEKINDKKRESYYYKIINLDKDNNKVFLGIIGFHKFNARELIEFKNEFFRTVFIMKKYQNLGIFTKANGLLMNEIRHHQPKVKKLYSLVRKHNDIMTSIANRKNIFDKEVKIKNEYFGLYYFLIPNGKRSSKYRSKFKSKQKRSKNISKKTKKVSIKQNDKQNVKKKHKNTFLIYVENFKRELAEDFLIQRGNWVKYDESQLKHKTYKPVDFIFLDNKINMYNKKLNSIKCFVKNTINESKHTISRKDSLYDNLGKVIKEHPSYTLKNYLLEQHNFNWLEAHLNNSLENKFQEIKMLFENNPNKIWIYKPVSGFRGLFIEIFRKYDEFKTYIDKFLEKQIPIWDNQEIKTKLLTLEQWVLQEYIEDPYLFQNKKFHIRPIFLYHKNGNNKIGYILNKIFVAHAYEDYKLEDFNNKRIHDTHFSSTSRRLFFHEDFITLNIMTKEQIITIEKQITDLAHYVFDQLNARCYPESNDCYEVFGMDLVIDKKTLTIKLMEVQVTNISFGHFDDDRVPGFSNMFEYIYCNTVETVIDKYFPPTNPIVKINGFRQFYQKAIKD